MKFRNIPDGEIEVLYTSDITTASERKQGLQVLLIAGKWNDGGDIKFCVWNGVLDNEIGDYILSNGDYCKTEEQAKDIYSYRKGAFVRDRILGIL